MNVIPILNSSSKCTEFLVQEMKRDRKATLDGEELRKRALVIYSQLLHGRNKRRKEQFAMLLTPKFSMNVRSSERAVEECICDSCHALSSVRCRLKRMDGEWCETHQFCAECSELIGQNGGTCWDLFDKKCI